MINMFFSRVRASAFARSVLTEFAVLSRLTSGEHPNSKYVEPNLDINTVQ